MTWLYVPPSCLSAQDTPASTLESESPAQVLAQSALWRSKRLPPRSWQRVWEKAPWLQLLSGLTLQPSTAQHGVEQWISSLRGSRASRIASPESALEPTTLATCGHTLPVSWERCALPWCSSKTSQGYLAPHFIDVAKTFKHWVTGLRSAYSVRRKSARRTNGNGSSSWPTPTAMVPNDGEDPDSWRAAQLKEKHHNGNGAGLPLSVAAAEWGQKMWPTPRSSMSENRTTKAALSHGKTHGRVLAGEAADFTRSHLDLTTLTDGEPTSQQADPPRLRLNPDFVNALMGLPPGWIDFER